MGSQEVLIGITGLSALAIQQDDKIVIASSTVMPPSDAVIVLLRYMPDGTPDSSFGVNGIYIDSTDTETSANDVVQQPDGKLIVCGAAYDNVYGYYETYPLVARYNTDGTPDKSFADNGKAIGVGTDFSR